MALGGNEDCLALNCLVLPMVTVSFGGQNFDVKVVTEGVWSSTCNGELRKWLCEVVVTWATANAGKNGRIVLWPCRHDEVNDRG